MPSKPRRRMHPPVEPPGVQPAASQTLAPRVIPLPAHLREIPSLDGVPELLGTRCVCFGLALVFLALTLGIPAGFAADQTVNVSPGQAILLLTIIGLLGSMTFLFVRAGLNAGAWFHVDATGMRYGVGRSPVHDPTGGTRIDWSEIVGKADRRYDVHTDFQTSQSLTKNLLFWRRLPGGEIVEHRLPMRLTSDIVRCMRFRNHDALIVAVLRGLASRPGLRFDMDVFIDAGVHPETWEPMKRPHLMFNLFGILSAVIACAFIWRFALVLPAWAMIASMLVVMFAVVWIGVSVWSRRFPDLNGVLSFDA